MPDQFLERVTRRLADVPGVGAVVLGGSRARGMATTGSDYDLGLYFVSQTGLDTDCLLQPVRSLVDDPDAAAVTPVGGWGPRIVGAGWLTVSGRKLDLLYRNAEAVAEVIRACHDGRVTMDYQPGHPHGFCSATWMGEVALCQPLHDPRNMIAESKAMAWLYPEQLPEALIQRFQWEVLFSIENGESAIARGQQTHTWIRHVEGARRAAVRKAGGCRKHWVYPR